MKKIVFLLFFLSSVSLSYSQRRQVAMEKPDTIIHKSLFSESQLKTLYQQPPNKELFPYMRIFIFQNGIRDTLILQYHKTFLDSNKIKQGYIPVYIR